MIDLSNLKSPAWQRVVAELTAPAADDRTFLLRVVGVLGHVAGARQAVLYTMPRAAEGAIEGEDAGAAPPRPILVWPPQTSAASGTQRQDPFADDPASQVTNPADMASAARLAIDGGQAQVFGFEKDEMFYDGGAGGHVISVPLAVGSPDSPAPVAYAVSMLVEGRSRPALQTTIALVELVAGYAHAHRTGQALKRLRVSSAALDLAARLIAAVNAAPSFKGAVLQLANDLVRQLHAERVSIGWAKGVGRKGEGESVHAVAISDTEHLDRRMAMVQKLEGAMNECFDQEQPVMFPPAPEKGPGADIVLATAITHAHRELAAGNAAARVISLPLRVEERLIGVVTVETAGGPEGGSIDVQTIELLQAVLDLLSPVLRIRRSDDRVLPLRAWDDALKAGAWLVGTTHTVWKIAGAALIALMLVLTLVDVPYRVEAPAELRPREQRVVSAPFDGLIASLAPGIEPGSRVEPGQTLALMDTSELRLQAINAQGEILRASKQADSELASGKLSEAQQSRAKAQQAQAELDLLNTRISQATLTAPIAGTIIAGDLRERVGSSVKLGDALFQIAPLEDMLVVAKVGDRDISLVEVGATGSVATKAYPAQRHAFAVERVVPLSQAEEGKNAFEVRARLESPAGWMRPGMEGFAKFDAGEHSLIWIGTRRIRDTLRLWLWW
ncbi:MAG: efflux RND transporter periplasmic adaptor subunit [Phycisphaeraceae bacterium]|nr:MAG: efflux RND transporter periplasmic adaptor subunit [Phycisphaeraceae bacterium]